MCACSSKSTWPPSTETKEDTILSLCTAGRKAARGGRADVLKSCLQSRHKRSWKLSTAVTNVLENCVATNAIESDKRLWKLSTVTTNVHRRLSTEIMTNVFQSCPQTSWQTYISKLSTVTTNVHRRFSTKVMTNVFQSCPQKSRQTYFKAVHCHNKCTSTFVHQQSWETYFKAVHKVATNLSFQCRSHGYDKLTWQLSTIRTSVLQHCPLAKSWQRPIRFPRVRGNRSQYSVPGTWRHTVPESP